MQDTFSIAAKKAALDIFLPDGRSIEVEILTSDTAERVLEVNIICTEAPEETGGRERCLKAGTRIRSPSGSFLPTLPRWVIDL